MGFKILNFHRPPNMNILVQANPQFKASIYFHVQNTISKTSIMLHYYMFFPTLYSTVLLDVLFLYLSQLLNKTESIWSHSPLDNNNSPISLHTANLGKLGNVMTLR